MLVTFVSSETGEILMFSEVARVLLGAMGKECTAKGAFVRDEMLAAAQGLRDAVARGESPELGVDDDHDRRQVPVGLGPRAWPLIDMLERSAKGGDKANVVWTAAGDF